MSLALAILAVATAHQGAPAPADTRSTTEAAVAADVEAAARRWLTLVDEGRWADSWKATGKPFRDLNTVEIWTSVSLKVRAPLGAMRTRTLISHDDVPAPPSGYQVVKFRTSFANKASAIETLSLVREGDAWRVVGVTVV